MMKILEYSRDEVVVLGKNQRQAELEKEIQFSRDLTSTYLIVAAGTLAIIACQHWTRALLSSRVRVVSDCQDERREAKSIEQGSPDGGASSSSSTLVANEIGDDEASFSRHQRTGLSTHRIFESERDTIDEETPLLSSAASKNRVISRYWKTIKSFAIYQPGPIPAITASSNSLPPNGSTLVILLLFVPNLFYLLYRVPFSLQTIIVLADRAGRCFVINLPILYLLGAKHQPLLFLTGRSYEALNIFHRRLGEWMIFLATVHSVCMIAFFWPLFRARGHDVWYFLGQPIILLGVLTFLAFIVIWSTSIGYVRQFYYEIFLAVHVMGQVIALALLFFHHPNSRPYVAVAVLIWAVDRIFMRNFIVPVTLDATAMLGHDEDTVLLSAKVPIRDNGSRLHQMLQPRICNGWKPGQHVFISVPSLKPSATLQAHPCSIASLPDIIVPDSEESAYRSLNLIIRAKNGFTLDLLNLLKSKQTELCASVILEGLQIRIDGPYGSTEAHQATHKADRVLLVAAGSGIAVTFPLAVEVLRKTLEVPEQEDVPSIPQEHPKNRMAHYWILRSKSHTSWLSHASSKPSLSESSTEYPILLPPQGTETLDPKSSRASLVESAVNWITDHGAVEDGAKIVVVVSGPDAMVRGVRNRCAELVKHGYDIDVFAEKFGW